MRGSRSLVEIELRLSLVNVELRKKLGFHVIRDIAEQHLFLCFLQFLLLILYNSRVVLAFWGPKLAILRVGTRFKNCFGVYSYSQQLLFSMFFF